MARFAAQLGQIRFLQLKAIRVVCLHCSFSQTAVAKPCAKCRNRGRHQGFLKPRPAAHRNPVESGHNSYLARPAATLPDCGTQYGKDPSQLDYGAYNKVAQLAAALPKTN